MKRYLPQDWKQMKTGVVTWNINSQHPPLDWLPVFWKFLNTHFKELSKFTGMPLIPVSPLSVNKSVLLARLQEKTTLIFQTSKQMNLPGDIAELVNKAGGTVVKRIEWLKHEDLDSFVLCPSPGSVVKLFLNLDSQVLIRELRDASHRAHEQLKEYLSCLDSVSQIEKGLLSELPLFQTMKGSQVAARSKQAVLLMSGLTVPTEFPMPDSVVQCATEADRRLFKLLEVPLLDTAEAAMLLIDQIEKGVFRPADKEKIMAWILQHGTVLFSQNQTLKCKCKNLRFIEVNGELKKTSSLFDPTNQTFNDIFESEFFPPPVYTQTLQMLKSLKELGLIDREADLSPEHLLHAANLIDQLHDDSQPKAIKRAQALLNMLDTNDLLSKFSHDQLHRLKTIKWVPCCNEDSRKSSFFSPDEIRHSMYEDIVGHVMPLVGKFTDRLSNYLGLKGPPPPEKVIENLSVLISKAEIMTDPDTNVDFKRKLRSIYEHMQNHLSEFAPVMNKTPHRRWMWSHNKFVSPQDLVLDYPLNLDLSSHIGRVPNEFRPYKRLLQHFGLRASLSDEEIVGILSHIQQTIEEREHPFATSSEIKVSIEILNWLWREKKTVQGDIPVPVLMEGERYTLKPLSEAVFCDVSKTGLNELGYSQGEICVLHEEIPKATAEWLSIQFLSTYILDPELVGIEQCGQSEPITTRIKNILKEYDEESDIFKELIQNAEDAGAEACKFLVDFRVHQDGPESLIDPDMTLCQGPCLWAFNNEKFTTEDWANIVRVGSASKESKVEKIGKFGLGFNTVYHVTDVPSILSGNILLILDPNVTHLKKHIKHKSNPGIKLNLSQQRLFHCFPGQFGPYECIFDCDFTKQTPPQPYPGTLIKLPFRTEEEALKSEISQKVYHKQDIITFQERLAENSKILLLFLKNINTLSLQSISKDASTPPSNDEIETVFSVSKNVNRVGIPDETSVSKQRQAEKKLMKLDGKCKEVIDSCTVNIIKITSKESGVTEAQFWLLYNCFGTAQSLKMALQENKQAKFSLPIGGVALPLVNHLNDGTQVSFPKDLAGQAFCFLPLSIHTGLPVNVNGTFAVTSNRKGLWESGVKRDWNKALLQDPVVTAYVTALMALKKMAENKKVQSYNYHTFWPNREEVSETFKPLVDALYAVIAQHSGGPELFSDGEHWCSMSCAIFLHESIEEDKDIGTPAAQVCKKHVKAPNHIVPLPQWLRNSFKQAGLEKALQSRTWNWEKFYREAVFNNLAALDPQSRDTLVLHAIDLNIQEINNLLVCYPCIPTKGGQLQYINKLVNPSGKVACLFEQEKERLLGGTKNDFCSPKRIQRLLELGMMNDRLSMEDITKKAGTITNTWSTDRKKAYLHLKCLLDLMGNHMNDKASRHWEALRKIEFLPAFCPGDIKMDRNVILRRPIDIFSDKCSLLVNMTQPVLDHTNLKIHCTDPVLQWLRVCDSPRPETVLQQLQQASKQAQSTDESMLHKIATECYKFLNQWLVESENSSFISKCANSFPFILVGSTFVNVSCVAENELFEAKPYLFTLPPSFSNFRTLWECVGVKKYFTIHQFQSVLHKLHFQHGNNPLPKRDLSICLTILIKGIFEPEVKTTDDCLIPNEDGVLQPASKMFYNDSAWMPVPSGVTLCHKSISRAIAQHFGIKTTRHHTLQNHVVENLSPFTFQFEQQEELTVRLKNIISAYPSKKDILKELIQNADDAEATEIHFVWDKRQHGKDKTFGKKWNHLQGPALCVFNNKVFSDADLKGIQQLGEGGKHQSPGKIGKYGVGFNSVYHLTDCPSILTGDEFLCISDPNQKYIESHLEKAPPGIGYKLADTFKNMYVDVYKSFLPDKFPLKEGTMFRLPLRTGPMAERSKISKQEVTNHDMEQLCFELSKDPEGLILFLNNIRKIKIHKIDEHSGNLRTVFVVEKSLPEESREEKDVFMKRHQDALQSDKRIIPQKILYETLISTSDKRQSRWITAQQFGSFKNSGEKDMSGKLPQAAVAARVSLKIPINPHQEPSSNRAFLGAAFCSLPLPGQTGLPVHISANFEVDSARRNLWKEDTQSLKMNWNEYLKLNVIAPLYADLLHHISCNLKVKKGLLTNIESDLSGSYLCFWPTVFKDVGQEWHEMIHETYRSIKERGLNLIPALKSSTRVVGGQPSKEYSIYWCNITETDSTKAPYLTDPTNKQINPILEGLGMTLVPFSTEMQKIWKSFKSADVEVKEVNPSTVQVFLREKPLNDPTQTSGALPLPITATLIKNEKRCSALLSFCLHDFERGLKKITEASFLDGLPLLLTKDKVLRVFDSKSPKLISPYERLFFGYDDQFASFQINEDHTEVLQNFNLVKTLTIPCAEKYLKPIIQLLLQECKVEPHSGLHVPNETIVKWLKVCWMFFMSQIKSDTVKDDDTRMTLSDVRQLFSDCCILPVKCPQLNNKHFLKTMKSMPSVIPYASKIDISGILFKLGFMALDTVFFSFHEMSLHSELMNVNDRGAVLEQLCHISVSEFPKLSAGEMTELQVFLQEGVSKCKDKKNYQRKLKSLPIFETIHGKRVRIDGPKQVFKLNSVHSMKFPDMFTLGDSNGIFLQNSPENCSLSVILQLQSLTDLEYFMKFILPNVHTFKDSQLQQFLKLLLFLQADFSYSKYKANIISSLKTVGLIRSSQGRLETASYYFDETVELYKKMLPKERFVPESLWTELDQEDMYTRDKLKQLLIELGMKYEVSNDEIINFAYQLELEAKGNCQIEELKQKSSMILKEALAIVSKNTGVQLLENIAGIKFIFPLKIHKELCNYHQPFAAGKTAVEIRGSLIESDPKHQQLIWSSMPIIHLPVYKSPALMEMMRRAGAYEKPPPHCVTSNMRNICQSPCGNDKLIKTRAAVFRSSYEYLQENGFKGQPLAGLPVVLIENDTALVSTDDVCLFVPSHLEFRPYLYRVSLHDLRFAEFFKKIGVKEKPTAVHYCNVLAAIYADSCDKSQLHSNQQKTVKRAVEQFFKLVKIQQHKLDDDNIKTLYVPAVDGHLYPSCTLYYNDTVFEIRRLENALKNQLKKFLLLEKLSECYLGSDIYEHHRLLNLLPQNLKPKMLSQVTEEKAVELRMQLCELETDCEFRGWFDKHLSSVAFRHGLICLIRTQSHGQTTQEDAAEMCKRTFGRIKIVCCKNLETMLWLEEQPLPKTAAETDVFVKREQQGCMFYLKHNNEMAPKVINDINMTLTKEINTLLDNSIASTHLPVLGQLLMCDSLEDVRKTLAKNSIHDSPEIEGFFGQPAPGSDIPEEWYDSLDMNLLNIFEEGEYVGYSSDDKYIYAVIVEELTGNSGPLSRRYKIDIGGAEPIEVSSLDLFQFKRPKKPKATGTTSSTELESQAAVMPQSSQSSVRGFSSSRSSSTRSSPKRSKPASFDEAKREIDQYLAEIWILSEEERHKAIKRLYLRWHPDKNPDCQCLATEVFQYLQNQINSGSVNQRENYRDFYQQWNQEARSHRNGRERFCRTHQSYNFWTYHENVPRPNRQEAQRWCRQARCDLNAAQKDMGGGSTEWCLFKVHQAVKKSLIAAAYKRHGQHPSSSSISEIAEEVSHYKVQLRVLPQIVEDLKMLGVDDQKTQYPKCHPFPHIPNGQFNSQSEMLASDRASELLSKIEAYVN